MPNVSTTGPLTIEDIRNPKRKSGFDHVNSAKSGAKFASDTGRTNADNRWRASSGSKPRYPGDPKANVWRGPTRKRAEEAAQDYCDYINGQSQATPATLKSAGHDYDIESADADPEYEAALGVIRDFKAQREGRQGYVYLITDSEYVKIGYSVNPKKRVAELQTGNARLLRLLATIEGTPQDERDLHIQFIEHNVLQEWFEIETSILTHFGLAEEAATV